MDCGALWRNFLRVPSGHRAEVPGLRGYQDVPVSAARGPARGLRPESRCTLYAPCGGSGVLLQMRCVCADRGEAAGNMGECSGLEHDCRAGPVWNPAECCGTVNSDLDIFPSLCYTAFYLPMEIDKGDEEEQYAAQTVQREPLAGEKGRRAARKLHFGASG